MNLGQKKKNYILGHETNPRGNQMLVNGKLDSIITKAIFCHNLF
jgi:hypothetical protein